MLGARAGPPSYAVAWIYPQGPLEVGHVVGSA